MTYKEIYDKFLIEYDKAGVSSSYPSLTKDEIASLLDKAAFALIAQKVTGNNPRKTLLDFDTKGMSDILSLIDIYTANLYILPSRDSAEYEYLNLADNEIEFTYFGNNFPMYLLGGQIMYENKNTNTITIQTLSVLSSIAADKFRLTSTNKPWIKSPIAFLQNNKLHILVDSDIIKHMMDDDDVYSIKLISTRVIKRPTSFKDKSESTNMYELSDTMCEELISLAVIFACKTVENPRLATEIQTKSLEA